MLRWRELHTHKMPINMEWLTGSHYINSTRLSFMSTVTWKYHSCKTIVARNSNKRIMKTCSYIGNFYIRTQCNGIAVVHTNMHWKWKRKTLIKLTENHNKILQKYCRDSYQAGVRGDLLKTATEALNFCYYQRQNFLAVSPKSKSASE